MVIWVVLDLCNLIFNLAGGPGLTALHKAQPFGNSLNIGLRLGVVANTCGARLLAVHTRAGPVSTASTVPAAAAGNTAIMTYRERYRPRYLYKGTLHRYRGRNQRFSISKSIKLRYHGGKEHRSFCVLILKFLTLISLQYRGGE